MTKLLVTGALGHIGSKFIREIKPGDFEKVVLFDNLSTQRYSSLFHLPDGIPFEFVEGDILGREMAPCFRDADVVLHLAAVTNAEASFDSPLDVERVNVEGTRRIAELCCEFQSRLIFPSTTSVYGSQESLVDETCPVLLPQSPYAESKLRCEALIQEAGKSQGLKFVIFRFGTVFGPSPGMRFHTAINKFIWQACTGKPLTVWRTALDQKRPYLDLTDAARAVSFAVQKKCYDNEIYNVLTGNFTVREIVDVIRGVVPALSVEYVDSKIMNQLSYEVSCEKFKERGFTFYGDLKAQVRETVRWLKNTAGADGS